MVEHLMKEEQSRKNRTRNESWNSNQSPVKRTNTYTRGQFDWTRLRDAAPRDIVDGNATPPAKRAHDDSSVQGKGAMATVATGI